MTTDTNTPADLSAAFADLAEQHRLAHRLLQQLLGQGVLVHHISARCDRVADRGADSRLRLDAALDALALVEDLGATLTTLQSQVNDTDRNAEVAAVHLAAVAASLETIIESLQEVAA